RDRLCRHSSGGDITHDGVDTHVPCLLPSRVLRRNALQPGRWDPSMTIHPTDPSRNPPQLGSMGNSIHETKAAALFTRGDVSVEASRVSDQAVGPLAFGAGPPLCRQDHGG